MAMPPRSTSPARLTDVDLAFLFDPMMAFHTSNVDPLPHQITAVYESMFPCLGTPVPFSPTTPGPARRSWQRGAPTSTSGEQIVMRADARPRVLDQSRPRSLVEQWKDELFQKVWPGVPRFLIGLGGSVSRRFEL